VTIEPGVYMPEEEIGVRIEDIVVLEEGGCRNLTEASRELRVVGRRTASAPSDSE
jgi:Xaa-Pro aminopeptidase